ncbi:putative RNA recognition motif domain, nucleotide-binding alpha-beta plait domain superfamily [Helianthus annuus]|nr:putative RNA recognition motif domain, nucleotide-binding alpha-beta plait domain superfamily [Helianthus annuus]
MAGSSGGFPVVRKFFVSNIPKGCRPWDLADAFRRFGEVSGAFIAKKKDKEGRTFGFVSFKGVRNVEELGRDLKKMNLGGNKLIVNLARYANENADAFPTKEQVSSGRGGAGRPMGGFTNRFIAPEKAGEVKKGFSFADIFLNKSSPVLDEDSIEIDPSINTLLEVVDKAVVARVLDLQILRKLNIFLWEAGFKEVGIQYIGGFSVLLSFNIASDASGFMDNKEVWKDWFSKVDIWKGQSLPFERLAWINIFGVPPHLLDSLVFDGIGRKYGKIAQGSQLSENDDDLSFDRLGILTDTGNKISGLVNLRWQDKIYRVWVVEESDPWIPDFLNKEGYGGDDVSLSSEFSVPIHQSPVVGEKLHGEGEELHGVSEEVALGFGGSQLAGGVDQRSVEVNEGPIPRNQENVRGQEINGCFKFSANSASGLEANKEGPSLVDQWANLVGHVSPRPRKRPRSNDSGPIEELFNNESGPETENIVGYFF